MLAKSFDTDRIVNFTKEYVRTIRTTFELIIRSFIATTLFSGFSPLSEFELMKDLKIQVRIEILVFNFFSSLT